MIAECDWKNCFLGIIRINLHELEDNQRRRRHPPAKYQHPTRQHFAKRVVNPVSVSVSVSVEVIKIYPQYEYTHE